MIEQAEIAKLSDTFLSIIDIKSRRYHGFTYRNVFVGSETVDAMIDAGMAHTRSEAVAIGRRLEKDLRLFAHVSGHHLFKDEPLFYRVSEKDCLALTSCSYDKELLMEKAHRFVQLANVQDRKYRFKKYKKCFVGSEVIDAMVYSGLVQSRQEGVLLGRALEHHLNWFRHVTGAHQFRDDHLFYRFNLEAHVNTPKSATASVAPVSSIAPSRATKFMQPLSTTASTTPFTHLLLLWRILASVVGTLGEPLTTFFRDFSPRRPVHQGFLHSLSLGNFLIPYNFHRGFLDANVLLVCNKL